MAACFPWLSRAPFAVLLLVVVAFGAQGCAEGDSLSRPDPRCGDGERQGDEICDNGVDNSDTLADACRTTCLYAHCGDGVIDTYEECDDGNPDKGDGCSDVCREEFVCGDNVCEVGKGETCGLCETDCCVCGDMECTASFGETCEMCPSECCPTCGDGALDDNEECDDGNNAAGDGCSPGCTDEDGVPTCGNGFLEVGEVCDDGNLTELDGCSPACILEYTCGDDVCESMRGESCQVCVQDCCPDCGNGVVDEGEQCDGANLAELSCTGACYDGGSLACTAWCAYDFGGCTGDLPTCGDGVAECDEACDGEDFRGETCGALGFAEGELTCASCAIDSSACGSRLFYLRESFDDACPPAGWTLGGDWECGTPTSVGPATARSAPACLATQIGGNYHDNQSYTTATATTAEFDLLGATEPVLSYSAWVHTEGSTYDGYNVKVSTDGGATFTLLTNVTPAYNLTVASERAWGGNQSALGWQPVLVDLQAYVGSTIVLRFAFRSDGSQVHPGVYIDDLRVSERASVPLEITTAAALPDAPLDEPYTQPLARTGGTPAAIWSITGGINHTWLSIDPVTGQLDGTPDASLLGPVAVDVRIEEPSLPSNFSERTFSFDVFDYCGNGVIDEGEQCDGAALAGLTCTGACYDGGALRCTPDCTYDFSVCTGDLPTCGDGVAECTEACDSDDLRGASCGALGYAAGTLGCASCAFDTSSCGARLSYLRENFDATCPPAGWTLGGDWECGTPTRVGPATASSAPACLATQIDGDYHDNQSYATTTATTPPIDLTTATDPVLGYNAWVYTEGSTYDGYNVKISTDGGATFTLLTDVTPAYNLTVGGERAWGGDRSALGWQPVMVNLQAYVGHTVLLRFAFRSDTSFVHPGVYIDDLQVGERALLQLAIMTAPVLPDASLGQPYTQPLTRTGGTPAATWSITGGTNHAWLSIDPVTGQLTGTPGTGDLGPVTVTVRVEEPSVSSNFSERTFSFNAFDYCGNGVIDPGEACDGSELGGATCTTACYDGGTLRCTARCTYDFSACTGVLPVCGDDVAGCDEACDGDDLRGETCDTLGYAGGALGCGSCALDTSGCGERLIHMTQSFDEGCPPAGWTLSGDWECGTPTVVGPPAASSAPACLATRIGGNYHNDQTYATTTTTTPPIDLTSATEPALSYNAWVRTEGSTYDGYNVKVSTDGGATFTLLTGVTPAYNLTVAGEQAWGGDQSALGWQPVVVDLQAYVGHSVLLRFAFRSDGSDVFPGVYIDDLRVVERALVPLAITTAPVLPNAPLGQPYTQPLTRIGGNSAATWSITGGTNHAWLSIDPVTGRLTGTPGTGELGPVTVTVRVEEPLVPSNFSERTFSFSVIDYCGNGVIDPGEACDGPALGGASCTAACYDGGTLGCTARCTYDFSACTGVLPVCGDGVAGCDEACDGDDLRGETCDTLGYADGTLGCGSCELDTSGCGPRLVYMTQSFDEGCPPSGWTLRGDWECGTPTVVGPPAARSAPACLATQIDENYHNNQTYATTTATTPPIDLTSATDPALSYSVWMNTEGSTYDGYNVKVSTDGGATFTLLTGVTPAYNLTVAGEQAWGGDQSGLGWQPVVVNLQAYVGHSVLLRFAFRSDGSQVRPGVYIDDLQVSERIRVPLTITTAPVLADAATGNPYAQPLVRAGGTPAATWSITGGTNHAWLSIDAVTGRLSGTPDASNLGPVSVSVRVQEPTAPVNFSDQTFSFNVVDAAHVSSFDVTCPAGWTLAGDWECGVPITVGPGSAFSGNQCIATQIDANYSNGQAYATTTATSPVIDLTSSLAPRLSFRLWINTESGADGANVKISVDGGPFTLLTGLTPGYNGTVSGQTAWSGDQSVYGWQLVTASLSAYAGHSINLQFSFRSDGSAVRPGVYIDDVLVAR